MCLKRVLLLTLRSLLRWSPPPPTLRWMGSCIPTWGWHGHNGNTPGAGGLLPPGTLATDIQQMAQIGPQRRAQLRNPNKCLCVRVCAPSETEPTIGIGLSTGIRSFVWGPGVIYWDGSECVWVWMNVPALSMLDGAFKCSAGSEKEKVERVRCLSVVELKEGCSMQVQDGGDH